tara:strand:+ start:513 stop:3140 length:2628 start_codon:yes stop_codon:yes gene_type:complete
MAFTLNRRLSTLVNSSGQLNTGKIPNDYISSDHVADNVITTAMLHSGFTLPTSSLSSIDTDNVTEGSSNLYFTNARVDSRLSGGTGVTYSSGAISIGQAVATTDNVTFADLTVTGDLTITGDINSYNVTDLDVADKTITIGKGQTESNSGGSGLIVDGASASILWDETNDEFDFNKGINVDSNTLVVDGTNNRVGILNASPDVSLDLGSATDGIHMPVGTTGQRPSSPAAGYFRYNSTDGQFEGYTTEWGAIAGSGGASAMETNNFTGNGSTTAFTLSSTVASEDNLIVFIEGIYQNKGDYVASGTTLTFTTAPVSGRRIVVQHILSSVAGNSTLYTSLTGDGSTTAFTLSGAPGHENNTQVFMDGVYQQKDSYIVNGTTLTFDAAPANSAEIEVMSFAQTTINEPGSNTVSVAQLNLSDGSSGQFITTDGNGTISFATVNGTTINNNANNRIITGSGTANTLEGESNFTFDGTTVEINNTGNADSTLLKLKNTPSTAGTYKTGLEFWSNEGTGNNQTFNAGRIYSEFDGGNYANTRLTLGSASGGGSFNDEVNITNGNVGIGTNNPDHKFHVDVGAPNSSDKTLAAFSSQRTARDIGFVWDDSQSTLGIATLTNNDLAFHTNGNSNERMRIDTSGDITMSGTGSLKVPSGTTAQRPSSPSAGMMRYNSTTSEFEVYSTMWLPMKTTAPLEFQQASTVHQKWTIAAGGQSAQAGSGYSAISVNLNFEGNFTVISKWSHDYMGIGIGYKAGITNGNFTGESNDGAGPYGGGASVDGFDSTVSYMGQYHWPVSNGGGDDHQTTWYIKHQRAGNTISTHYSTNAASATDPSHSSWSQVQSATISSTDHCKPLWGEASTNESVALTLLYSEITGGFNDS